MNLIQAKLQVPAGYERLRFHAHDPIPDDHSRTQARENRRLRLSDDPEALRHERPSDDLVIGKRVALDPIETIHDLDDRVDIRFAKPFAVRDDIDAGPSLHVDDETNRVIHVALPEVVVLAGARTSLEQIFGILRPGHAADNGRGK